MSTTEHPEMAGLSEWRPLARGGLAVVWEARQRSLDRLVAVKVYQRPLHGTDQRHFVRESVAARRLSAHPGIVTTYASGILPDDRPYLVMELCSGGSLTKWLKPENRPTEERIRQVGLQVADALAAAHAAGVLHSDIKPANILLDDEGNPRLADFGLAAELEAHPDAGQALWVTPAWAPPEVLRMQRATESGDVFSLAATLYALLAGHPPRTVGPPNRSLEPVMEADANRIPPIPGVSWPLMGVILAALDDDPAARPTAAAFFGQLARVPVATLRREAVNREAVNAAAIDQSTVTTRGHFAALNPVAIANSHGTPVSVAQRETKDAPDQVPTADAPRRPEKRRLSLVALAAALVVAIASATVWLIEKPASSGTSAPIAQSPAPGRLPPSAGDSPASEPPAPPPSPPTETPSSGDETKSGAPEEKTIKLMDLSDSAKPFQAVPIRGTFIGGANAFLRVQRWEEGAWRAFPVPTRTDQSGQFTAHVELGQPGRYRIRVVNPDSGVKSEPVELVIKG